MGYNIGQIRRTTISSYSTDIVYSQGLIENEEAIVTFYDPYLLMRGSSNTLSSASSYYLKFTVAQLTGSVQNFTIILRNSESVAGEEQEIKNFSVKQGTETTTFELIFHPNATYDELVFELSRLALDFNQDNGDGTSGRIMDVQIKDFYLVNNIVTDLSSLYSGLTTLSKIGIQGPPGMMFCVNGEEMRIGRSGVYELYNDNIEISYIGFIIKDSIFTQDGQDFFIMDFKY